ncbi:hypothetical protein [Phormidesmis priestleyi]
MALVSNAISSSYPQGVASSYPQGVVLPEETSNPYFRSVVTSLMVAF